jgi:uncharacterized membrane protein
MAESDTTPAAGGPPAANDPADGKMANLIYILYLASLIFGLTALVGVVMAYINQREGASWVDSHYRFQIRTFWIGLLFFAIATVTLGLLVGYLVLLFLLFWWVIRCARGMMYLSRGQAHPDPTGWMFG